MILWDADPAAREQLRFTLGQDLVQLGTGAKVIRALEENPSVPLVLIGPDVSLAEACTLAEQQRVDHPDLGVVLMRRRTDVGVLAEALRSGIREVVEADDLPAVTAAVRRSQDLTTRLRGANPAQQVGDGRVVTVFSAKGGVGKTMTAVNTAVLLAEAGNRTLLVDLDLMFGDVAISLQLDPLTSLADAVPMAGHLDADGLRSLTLTHKASGLDVVAAPTDPVHSDHVPAAVVSELLRLARSRYDYVVVDTPPSISDQVLAAFDASELIVLIATLDIPAVKNLRVAMGAMDAIGVEQDHRVVVLNRANDKVGLGQDEVEGALRTSITATVPHHTGVAVATNNGTPIATEEPKNPASLALRAFVNQHIRARFGDAVEASPSGWRRRRR